MASIKGISITNYSYIELDGKIEYSCYISLDEIQVGSFYYSSHNSIHRIEIDKYFQDDFFDRITAYYTTNPSYIETTQEFMEDLITLSQLEKVYKKHFTYNHSLYLLETYAYTRTTDLHNQNLEELGNKLYLSFSKEQNSDLIELLEPKAFNVYSSLEDFVIY